MPCCPPNTSCAPKSNCSPNTSCPPNTNCGPKSSCTPTYDLVSSHYGKYAETSTGENAIPYNSAVAASFGYSAEELATIPADANLGLSCGNPLATANLKPNETLIDLGSGGGLDVLLAARKLTSGRAIGVDMTPSMNALARRNAASANPPITNAEFVEANISDLSPIPSETADIVTSNCVINLVPDEEKPKVFKEIWRVLKKGGRVAVSDLLKIKEIPEEVRGDVGLYIGCVGGASLKGEYEKWMREAGFEDVVVIDTRSDVNVYKEGIMAVEVEEGKPKKKCGGCCAGTTIEDEGPETEESKRRKEAVANLDLNQYVASYKIFGVKTA